MAAVPITAARRTTAGWTLPASPGRWAQPVAATGPADSCTGAGWSQTGGGGGGRWANWAGCAAWQIYVLSATGNGEGGYILRVVDKAVIWAEKVAITSLPFQVNGSTAGTQTVFGSEWGYGAVLYSLQCPTDEAATVVVLMVSDAEAAAGFEVPR